MASVTSKSVAGTDRWAARRLRAAVLGPRGGGTTRRRAEAGVTTDAGYTVKDAVIDFLQKGLKGRAKGTVDSYRSLADHNSIPQIGGIKVKELTADQVGDWLDERAEELSTRSLRLIHQIVERAIRLARRVTRCGATSRA